MQCEHHHGELDVGTDESPWWTQSICTNLLLPKNLAISEDIVEHSEDLGYSEESLECT